MKQIKSLSAVVSANSKNDPKKVSDRAVRKSGDAQSLDLAPLTMNPSPESNESSTRQSSSSQADRLEKKLVSASRETPLSIVKSSPLSLFTSNNKVGSSFDNAQQRALMSYQQQLNSGVLPVSERKVRDSGSLLFMIAFLGFLGYIIWDGIIVKDTDINLIVHGHDSYGNICGRQNKPIKFVEKSGKNYTSRPYTKYTLINAQFERYTLDTNRLKYGELLYVKQDPVDSFVRSQSPISQLMKENSSETTGLNDLKNRSRLGRSAQLDQRKHFYESINQTSLNNLKSKMMYQYPPMYGYSSPTPPPIVLGNDLRESMLKYRGQMSPSNINPVPIPGLSGLSKAQMELIKTNNSAGGNRSTVLFATTAPPIATAITTQSSLRKQSTTTMVLYDERAVNDSDRYDHIMVEATSTNFIPGNTRTPEILNQNEVSSQLLYLTECVDHCPTDHIELIFYRCMPQNWRFSLFPNAINVTRTFIDDILTDVSHCYRELIYIFSFALVLSLALLILLRFLASFIIWSCLIMLITLFLSMATYSWLSYYNQIIDLNNAMPHDSIYVEKMASSDKWFVGAIFLTFVAFAGIGIVIFMRKRILLVTALFKESGKAIADMPLLLLQPLLTFSALVSITFLWSIGLICLQSMKTPVIDMNTGFVVFKAETLYKIMKWYHIFAFLWVSHFAIACQHYVIGAAVSKWYFSPNRYNLNSPIGSSVSELILYYLGSVALGSFLVAIFKVIRIIVRQIQYLVQRNCVSNPNPNLNTGGTSQTVAMSSIGQNQISTSCCGSFSYIWRLFIWFFDNIVMIISRDAYVEIAIHGHSFITGAQKAFAVLASNPLKLLAIKSVGNLLLAAAKICVVIGTVSMATLLLEEKNQQLNYSWSPVVISAIYAYIVAHWFLSVYEMVIDALFICYCEDYERSKNQEAANNQMTASDFMSQFLNNNNIGNQLF